MNWGYMARVAWATGSPVCGATGAILPAGAPKPAMGIAFWAKTGAARKRHAKVRAVERIDVFLSSCICQVVKRVVLLQLRENIEGDLESRFLTFKSWDGQAR